MDEQIIIGEGVILDARPASFATRGLALVIDVASAVILIFIVLYLMSGLAFDAPNFTPAIGIALVVFFLVILPTGVEALSRGRSLGKWAMGLQVVRDDGGPITLRHSFIRALVGVGEIWLTIGVGALVVSVFNSRGKRIGDLLAGTFVLRVRGGGPKPAALVMPPYLERWALSADIGKLPDGLALACRQFIGRLPTLHPGSRAQMAQDFATRLSTQVAPDPPQGTNPEDFIAAVVLERSRREQLSETAKNARAATLRNQLESLPYGIDNPKI